MPIEVRKKISSVTLMLVVSLIFGIIGSLVVEYRTSEQNKQISGLGSNSAIRVAKEKDADQKILQKEAGQLGFNCFEVTHAECKDFLNRVKSNQKLRDALDHAKTNGVTVYPNSWTNQFDIDNEVVIVAFTATDQQIIDFLLGKKQ